MTHETEHERDEWRSWWAPVASQFDQANKQEVSLATWLAARSKPTAQSQEALRLAAVFENSANCTYLLKGELKTPYYGASDMRAAAALLRSMAGDPVDAKGGE